MTKEQVITRIKHSSMYKDDRETADYIITALEIVEDFERAQIITGGRLNGRTYAYKCGLEDGKRKALEQQSSEDCVSRAGAISAIRNLYTGTPFVRLDMKKWQEENKKYFECENVIKDLPPVIPTHGTCKDCKHWERVGYAISSNGRCKHFDDVWRGNSVLPLEHGTTENFYCADFRKRGNDTAT